MCTGSDLQMESSAETRTDEEGDEKGGQKKKVLLWGNINKRHDIGSRASNSKIFHLERSSAGGSTRGAEAKWLGIECLRLRRQLAASGKLQLSAPDPALKLILHQTKRGCSVLGCGAQSRQKKPRKGLFGGCLQKSWWWEANKQLKSSLGGNKVQSKMRLKFRDMVQTQEKKKDEGSWILDLSPRHTDGFSEGDNVPPPYVLHFRGGAHDEQNRRWHRRRRSQRWGDFARVKRIKWD